MCALLLFLCTCHNGDSSKDAVALQDGLFLVLPSGCKGLSLHSLFISLSILFNALFFLLPVIYHFPMQKREKMDPRTSSVVISPVMLPR